MREEGTLGERLGRREKKRSLESGEITGGGALAIRARALMGSDCGWAGGREKKTTERNRISGVICGVRGVTGRS